MLWFWIAIPLPLIAYGKKEVLLPGLERFPSQRRAYILPVSHQSFLLLLCHHFLRILGTFLWLICYDHFRIFISLYYNNPPDLPPPLFPFRKFLLRLVLLRWPPSPPSADWWSGHLAIFLRLPSSFAPFLLDGHFGWTLWMDTLDLCSLFLSTIIIILYEWFVSCVTLTCSSLLKYWAVAMPPLCIIRYSALTLILALPCIKDDSTWAQRIALGVVPNTCFVTHTLTRIIHSTMKAPSHVHALNHIPTNIPSL